MKLTEAQIAHVKFLEDNRGGITPDLVLADAERPDSPLHELFDWDLAKAARKHWLDHARTIIREVKIVITTTTTTVKAPYYTRDPDATGQGYRSVEALRRDEGAAKQALIAELNRAAGSIQRAQAVALALNLSDELDDLLRRVIGLQREVEAETETAPPPS